MLLTNGGSEYLTTAEVAARYRTAASTVRYWRHIGYGPKGIKVGRRILYAPAEIERFEQALGNEQSAPENNEAAGGCTRATASDEHHTHTA